MTTRNIPRYYIPGGGGKWNICWGEGRKWTLPIPTWHTFLTPTNSRQVEWISIFTANSLLTLTQLMQNLIIKLIKNFVQVLYNVKTIYIHILINHVMSVSYNKNLSNPTPGRRWGVTPRSVSNSNLFCEPVHAMFFSINYFVLKNERQWRWLVHRTHCDNICRKLLQSSHFPIAHHKYFCYQ